MSDAIQRGLASLLIGESISMRQLRSRILKIAPSPLPVLIQGPTGSGKELVAKAVHLASGRRGSFVAFNVCAIAEPMFEDALFGHVRGAFTGAAADAPGYLLEGNEGTVFLDEIGALPLPSQAKLLRAIETREFRPIGSRHDRRSEFRLISATNEQLRDISGGRRFREDLLFRLRSVLLEVPPLADRAEDIPLLANHFAQGAFTERGSPAVITGDALAALVRHTWPGNVRELKSVVECAAAIAEGGVVKPADLLCAGIGDESPSPAATSRTAFLGRRLLDVLHETSWDVDATAALLGVHRATVYRRLVRIGVNLREEESRGRPASTAAPVDSVRATRPTPRTE